MYKPLSKTISWTHHALAKMNFYKLSKPRVLRVLHSPKRIEEGVAPKTVAMMQPVSVFARGGSVSGGKAQVRTPLNSNRVWNIGMKKEEDWTQEIWVMIEDAPDGRVIISAWRYPGKTKPKSESSLAKMREEYQSFVARQTQDEGIKKRKKVV